MIKLKIKVTKEILDRAKFCTMDRTGLPGHNCAIALAVREVFPYAWVYIHKIAIYQSEEEIQSVYESMPIPIGYIDLPSNAVQFITKFDNSTWDRRLQMNELEFEVEIPDSILETINIDEIRGLLKNSSTLELKEV